MSVTPTPRGRLGMDADYGVRTDAELLDLYLMGPDPEAFAGIVRRHGPMVLGVCRRVLRHDHDADDAFQATFLVLAHKAGSVRPPAALAAWLHGVARRTALRARSAAARRADVERRAPPRLESRDPVDPDSTVDEELARLPDRYRLPIVLCDLEGRLRTEVAAALGCSDGTLSSRLTRGRRLLAERLQRRGVAVPAAVLAGTLVVQLTVAEPLLAATARYAEPSSAVPKHIAALARGVMNMMLLKKLVVVPAVVLSVAAAVLVLGLAGLNLAPAAPQPTDPPKAEAKPAAKPEPVVLKGHTKAVNTVAWAADGKTVATASDDRDIRVWDPTTGKETTALKGVAKDGYGGPVVAFNADLSVVAVNYWGDITIRTVADNKELVRIDPILDRGTKSAFRPDVFAMAVSPDGKRLVTGGSRAAVGGRHGLPGGVVVVWDVKTGKAVHTCDKLSTAASSVGWSADGKRFVAGTNGAGGELPESGVIHVWETESGKELHAIRVKDQVEGGEWASAGDVAVSPDGKRIAVPVTAGSRGAPAGLIIDDTGATVAEWDLATGKSTQPVSGLKAAISRVAYSPDGKRLATAGRDKSVRVWDLETGKELIAWTSTDRVAAVAFSPNGKTLAAGSADGRVTLYPIRERE